VCLDHRLNINRPTKRGKEMSPSEILGSDAHFEYTSCYFKVVTLFIRNLFRVRLPYLLLTKGLDTLRCSNGT
jgi:hypothetical protein